MSIRSTSVDSQLPRLNRFVLPGGNEPASRAHICRTVARRAERLVYHVAESYPVAEEVLIFLNPSLDYFFVLARKEKEQNSRRNILGTG